MTTSTRLLSRRSEKFSKNILKRGQVQDSASKKGEKYPVGPFVLGFFIFVVVGSSLFQIIRTAQTGSL
ncbi:hypothetical protein CBR_g39343 [Chara braunii]|uniref:Stress-associated endoplasmic reticulum protein n=1 Tax=Chara braunii TaxID=69332 RepID=A0A388LRI4_CHABU|nr:hypothetical protein CBR_g39343 [Chara braunii]|eukprot:GBG84881.1 hypothetical protein CBR_g39343 [Chara braunii]